MLSELKPEQVRFVHPLSETIGGTLVRDRALAGSKRRTRHWLGLPWPVPIRWAT